jgi:hypothetical protein
VRGTGGSLSEPARDISKRKDHEAELDSILREAEDARRTAGLRLETPLPKDAPSGPSSGSDEIKFHRFDIEVTEPGENKIPAYKISWKIPTACVLGLAAAALWLLVPAGIDWVRPKPLPATFTDASSRWWVVLTAERIDKFSDKEIRLPNTLDEIEPGLDEFIRFRADQEGGGYTLEAPGKDGLLVLESGASRNQFAAGASDVLRAGPRGRR